MVLHARGTARLKVGFSASPRARLAQLATGSAVPLDLLFVVPITSRAVEARAHELLKFYRLLGEWFDLGDDLNAFARGLVDCDTAEQLLALMSEFGRNPAIGNIIRSTAGVFPSVARRRALQQVDRPPALAGGNGSQKPRGSHRL